MRDTVSLAVLGCGAIAEAAYLPALAAHPGWRPGTWLVEPNLSRGQAIAQRFGFAPEQVVADLGRLPSGTALAINATPSHIHLATTLALIERGIDVLVEKPFAETARDAEAMIAAAAGRCLLSVNQSRRAGPSNRLVREIIRDGKLGTLEAITWHEGHKFDWPSQSGFNFRRPWQGRARGVLLDIGVHVLDLISWWTGGTPAVVAARMDGCGGPEASVTARLTVDGAAIDLKLSYLAKLSNQFIIEGSRGTIRGSTADYDRIDMRLADGPWRTIKARGSTDKVEQSRNLVANMLAASAGQEALAIEAASTVPALTAIDELYAKAGDLLSDCYREFAETRMPLPHGTEQELA